MTEFTNEQILKDLKQTHELIKEEREHRHKDLSPLKLIYTISQEHYNKAIEYYKLKQFEEANLVYELAQLKYSQYLKQITALRTKNKKTTAKQP